MTTFVKSDFHHAFLNALAHIAGGQHDIPWFGVTAVAGGQHGIPWFGVIAVAGGQHGIS